jgi:hypothetical protein
MVNGSLAGKVFVKETEKLPIRSGRGAAHPRRKDSLIFENHTLKGLLGQFFKAWKWMKFSF